MAGLMHICDIMTEIDKNVLNDLFNKAREIDSPHVDLSSILGADHPVNLRIHDLHEIIIKHELPTISLSYENKILSIQPKDGGAMINFSINI